MSHSVLLRCAPAASARSIETLERLDEAVASLVRDLPALELARDRVGSLLAFTDVPAAARFALTLRESSGKAAGRRAWLAFAIEGGLERVDASAGRPPRASGAGLATVDDLVELALPGQILAGRAIADALASVVDVHVASLGTVTLGTEGKELFEIDRSERTTFYMPRRRGAFIGREAELARLGALLEGGARLVTLVGPAGVGKTRLALELATRSRSARGSAFVDLGIASVHDELVRRLALALDVSFVDEGSDVLLERTLGLVASGLRDFLLLDGLEIAEGGARLVAALLGRAPELRLVVTAREPLGHPAETCVRLEPLSQLDAERLFACRCEEAGRGSTQDAESPIVSEIVRVLDGLPLALEIAAGRMGERHAGAVLEELEAEPVTADALLELDRSLHSALNAAYRSLTDGERRVLALVSALPGGMSSDCLESLDASASLEPPEATIARLCRKSIVVDEADGATSSSRRFRAPSCVRRFVARTLSPAEAAAGCERVARAILVRAGGWATDAHGSAPAGALDRLAGELENLGALHGELARAAPELAVRCALVLDVLLAARGPRDLHLDLLASAADIAERVDPTLTCDVRLARAASLANVYGDPGAALDELAALHAGSVQGARAAKRDWIEGICAHASARYPDAERALNSAQATFKALDDAGGEARALNSLGNVLAHQGRLDEGARCYQAALACHVRTNDVRHKAVVLQNLARLARERAEHERASVLFEEALALARELGDARVEGMAWAHSGLAAHDRGDLPAAARRYEAAVAVFAKIGEWRFRAWTQVHFALCALEAEDLPRSRELLAQCAPRDPLTEGLRTGARAALAAVSGEHDEAARAFARARGEVAGDPLASAGIRVLEGVLEAALAARARSLGRDADADALVSAARARWASATRSDPPACPPAEQSSLVRLAGRLIACALGDPRRPPTSERVLEVADDAGWFQPPGEARIDVSRRTPLRRVLAALVQRRLETPSTPAKAAELIAAAWPDERIERGAAKNRLYVAIATLRKAGIGDLLITRQDGYMLDPNVPLVVRGPVVQPS